MSECEAKVGAGFRLTMRRPIHGIVVAALSALVAGCGSSDVVTWDEADKHVGETAKVCGPMKGMRSARTKSGGDVTFVNVGKNYPDPDRFTFVLFGQDLGDADGDDLEVCGEGVIRTFKGALEMKTDEVELADPEAPPGPYE